jgi:threonylcarbamoyladenosine tRNA methylthiotransferase MtaB
LRIGSIEPQDVGADLVALLGLSDGTLCRHLHLPLQSGSDRVLAEMNRPYDVGFYTDLVERLYAAAPGMSLSTDVIVGFPGETDKNFQETLDLCRRCRFSKIHVFPYSLREGTPAAKRADQIPPAVKKERARVLRELGAQLRAEDLLRRAGSSEYALVETDRCVTESYHELPLPAGVPTGSLISVSMPAHQLKI